MEAESQIVWKFEEKFKAAFNRKLKFINCNFQSIFKSILYIQKLFYLQFLKYFLKFFIFTKIVILC